MVFVLVCSCAVGKGNGVGTIDKVLDEDLAVILEVENNDGKRNTIEDSDAEMLPRGEKSLLGTFPFSGHQSSSYNPRARQPLPSSSTGFNGDHEHGGVHVEHNDGYAHEGGHGHDGVHQSDYAGYDEQRNTHHEYHEQHQYDQNPERNQLLKFPYEKIPPFVNDNHHPIHKNSNPQFPLAQEGGDFTRGLVEKATLDQLQVLEVGNDGRKCVNKVMMREETEYDEILTCDHSFDNRCHTSYVTRYEPHQEEECEEKFRKVCVIDYEQKANQEVVEVCTSSFIPDCDVQGEAVCQTVYTSECSTVQIVHEVEDDIANCQTIEEEKCEDVTDGFRAQRKCDTWPREKCTLDKKKVKKYTPQTSCKKVPQEACAPAGCGVKEGPVNCQDKVKTIISENPVEDCDMEPLRTCKHVTKLVPKLETVQDCVDVPKEICARSKVNPRKVKKPSIQKWCFTPK